MTSPQPKITDPNTVDPYIYRMAEENITAATLWLTRNECFYSTLWLGLIPQTFEGTFGVTRDKFYWDPAYVMTNTAFELRFKMMHEVLHVAMKHWDPRRLALYTHEIRNMAYDYCINLTIVKAGQLKRELTSIDDPSYHMPEDGLLDWAYDGMLPEEIAALLVLKGQGGKPGEEEGEGGEGQPGEGGWGEVFDAEGEDGALTDEQLKEFEEEMERKVIQAEAIAKSRGQMPGNLTELLGELRDPSIDWAEQLFDIMRDTIPTDLSYAKPNRLRMESELVMPSIEKDGLGHVLILKDESGSVSAAEDIQFFSEMDFIFEELNPEKISLIRFDYDADEPETYEPGDTLDKVRRHHGGTRFAAAFAKAKETGLEDDVDICIFLSDGDDDSYPDEEPPYPVIWAVTGAFWQGDPPFGTIVPVKFKK